jgi:glycosyltransferase A (GT-A) superfamily protein (DUF2064 family)
MSGLQTVLVVAKEPIPGRVKTRLIGSVSGSEAAELAEAALQDTLTRMADVSCMERVLLLEGRAGPWLPDGWRVVAQSAGELDQRLSAGFEAVADGPCVLVGMDTPQLQPNQLRFDHRRYDACLGLAADGGYWAIGLREPRRARSVISGVPMSTAETGAIQYARLLDAGMSVQLMDTLVDVDTVAAAEQVARIQGQGRFASAWQRICR